MQQFLPVSMVAQLLSSMEYIQSCSRKGESSGRKSESQSSLRILCPENKACIVNMLCHEQYITSNIVEGRGIDLLSIKVLPHLDKALQFFGVILYIELYVCIKNGQKKTKLNCEKSNKYKRMIGDLANSSPIPTRKGLTPLKPVFTYKIQCKKQINKQRLSIVGFTVLRNRWGKVKDLRVSNR